jgi:hypothetical protein
MMMSKREQTEIQADGRGWISGPGFSWSFSGVLSLAVVVGCLAFPFTVSGTFLPARLSQTPISAGLPAGHRIDQEETPNWPQDSDDLDFARDILPIFDQHCWSCHGPARQESNLRLDVREGAMGTADWGQPVIVPGDGQASLLYQFITGEGDLLMPPEGSGEPLSAEQVGLIQRWIDAGANWPDEFAGEQRGAIQSNHWSFQPLAPVDPPEVFALEHFPFNSPIDRFVLARQVQQQLSPSVVADPRTLIRRLYLNMHGLLPTPGQVAEFEADPSQENYRRLVDQVLDSPRYGERWARHWLDVVRFGESTGYEVNRDRANAYYYRDYVIEALNSDLPYQQFVKEQLVGDALGVDEATGFLVGGPYDIVKSPDINLTLMQREDELADFVNTTTTTFLGLTVACARCHNHKFDPILQRDYYAIQAVFAGVRHGERRLVSKVDGQVSEAMPAVRQRLQRAESELSRFRELAGQIPVDPSLLSPVQAQRNVDQFPPVTARFIRFSIQRTNSAEPCLDELEVYGQDPDVNLALADRGTVATSGGDYQGNPKHQLLHVNDGRYGNDHSWIADKTTGWVQLVLPEAQLIQRVVWGRDRQGQFRDRLPVHYAIEVSLDQENWQTVSDWRRRQAFVGEDGRELEDQFLDRLSEDLRVIAVQAMRDRELAREELRRLESQIPLAYVGEFADPLPIRRLHRGDPLAPLEEVPPGVITLLQDVAGFDQLGLNSQTPEQQRRLALADWITSDQNPLTARVIVNRVWHYHFGRGLVWTTSDFGTMGDFPSHPELLDWLADQFIRNGWSLKWLHREILNSSTFRQASQPRSEPLAADAESRLLWRFPPRRLEAEAIRDNVLQVTGKLDLTMGGPGFLLFEIDRENVHHYFPLEKFQPQHFRRMIYMTKIRQEQDDVFGQFDCPDGSQTIPNRNQSTTALQALNLLNSPFMLEQAEFLAGRLQQLAPESLDAQVRQAYRLLFSREPDAEELQEGIEFIQRIGLSAFCRAMLNANEFLYLS